MFYRHELSQKVEVLASDLIFWIQQALSHDDGVVFDCLAVSFVKFLQINKKRPLRVWEIDWYQSGIHQTVTCEWENIRYWILLVFWVFSNQGTKFSVSKNHICRSYLTTVCVVRIDFFKIKTHLRADLWLEFLLFGCHFSGWLALFNNQRCQVAPRPHSH